MKKSVIWLVVLMLLAFLAGIAVVVQPFGALRGNLSLPVLASKAPVSSVPVDARVQREVILYFGAPDSPLLEQETGTIDECDTDEECIMGLVQALIAGPTSGDAVHIPVLPSEALLLGAEVVADTARLNFNQALISHHPGGSSSELLTVYALVNTLAANLPHIRQLVLLVDGQPISTLRGHVDLRQPIGVNFSLVRQESEVATQEELTNQTAGKVDSGFTGRQQTVARKQPYPQSTTTGEEIDE